MLRVTVPCTQLITSRLGFGTASLHHLPTAGQRLKLLATAFEHGFAHFDTAPMYGEGMAERTLGSFLAGGRRGHVTLCTKVGFPARPISQAIPQLMYLEKAAYAALKRLGFPGQGRRRRSLTLRSVENSFTNSLRRLRTDAVDILFLHDPETHELPDIERLADWLARQKQCGRARYLGLAGRAAACVSIIRSVPGLFEVLQVEDSLHGHEADPVVSAGLPLQITYGYFRLAMHSAMPHTLPTAAVPHDILEGALARNPFGILLVSTRKGSRLRELSMSVHGAVHLDS